VDEVIQKYQDLMKFDCTGCGYCLPCPLGVMIPDNFEVYNKMHMFGNEAEGKFVYVLKMSGELTGRDPGYASQCEECGECVERCPQNLAIPDHLATIAEEMEGPDLPERLAAAKQMLQVEG
jgi:predicted aldo/keto reductase-like oxidoreductase